MVPHPVVIFLILIGIVIVLSAVLGLFGAAVTFERINPDTHEIETATTAIRSLLNTDGIRFMYASLVPELHELYRRRADDRRHDRRRRRRGIRPGHGADPQARHSSRRHWALTYILAFVGILSSIAADAGYLVLIPLAGVAYLASGGIRWPAWRSALPPWPAPSRSTC